MNCCVLRTCAGVLSPRVLTGTVLAIALFGLYPGQVSAKALNEEACAALDAEMLSLVGDGVDKSVQKGPEWGRANLTPAQLETVKRFLIVEEQIVFRCQIVDKKPASRVAKGKKGAKKKAAIPLPLRNPERPTTVVAAASQGPITMRASVTENLGAIMPANPRAVIALPHLSAAVAPLAGLRSGLEPSQLALQPPESKEKKKTEEGSTVAALEEPVKKDLSTPAPVIAPEAKGPLIPLPVRNPLPSAVRKQAAKPRREDSRARPAQRVKKRRTPVDEAPPSAASVFATN